MEKNNLKKNEPLSPRQAVDVIKVTLNKLGRAVNEKVCQVTLDLAARKWQAHQNEKTALKLDKDWQKVDFPKDTVALIKKYIEQRGGGLSKKGKVSKQEKTETEKEREERESQNQ